MRPRGLSRELILRTALRLVDEGGIESLTMRRLGSALGVEAMSLYYYARNKADVLDGVVEIVLAEVRLPPARSAGDDELIRVVLAFRRVMLAHPALFPIVASRPTSSPKTLRLIARVFSLFEAGGLRPESLASAWSILLAYTLGHILSEVGGGGAASRSDAVVRFVEAQRGEEFAALRSAWGTTGHWDSKTEFIRGLEVVIAGLKERFTESAATDVGKAF